MNLNQLLQGLLKLQAIDFGDLQDRETGKQIAELRKNIPTPILDHYDRLHARGKKGLSAVRNQVCTGCHVQVPRATVIQIMRGEDVQVCENCGRYLYLPDTKEPAPTPTRSAKKRTEALPHSRELAHAV